MRRKKHGKEGEVKEEGEERLKKGVSSMDMEEDLGTMKKICYILSLSQAHTDIF